MSECEDKVDYILALPHGFDGVDPNICRDISILVADQIAYRLDVCNLFFS